MVYGQEGSDQPYPVKYHGDGLPAEGIDPRELPDWEPTDTTDSGAENDNLPSGDSNHAGLRSHRRKCRLGLSRQQPSRSPQDIPLLRPISQELVGARCYGEDVNLLVDGEIEQEHMGHLRE